MLLQLGAQPTAIPPRRVPELIPLGLRWLSLGFWSGAGLGLPVFGFPHERFTERALDEPLPRETARPAGRVGFVGSSARHHEFGPIALALVKRNIAVDLTLLADGIAAAQEALVDPEVGLHVRPALR